MKIAAIKETKENEARAAITPESAKLLVKIGCQVFVEKDIGLKAGFSNSEYEESGAKVSNVPLEVLGDADIVLKIAPSDPEIKLSELSLCRESACIIAPIYPSINKKYIEIAAKKGLTLMALERIPRTSIAQSMDILSSQSNLAGYKAVIEAAYHYKKGFPLLMTSAGTVSPAKVLVIGAGVAGLQAIATAKRLGGNVFAYDVRAAAKEQVESLGGKFLVDETAILQENDKSGYAKELKAENELKQKNFLSLNAIKFDIIITTALIPGKPAPTLIYSDCVKQMKPGSVIIDMASAMGGNVESSEDGKILDIDGVKVIGASDLNSKIAYDSSNLFARNLYNFIKYAMNEDSFEVGGSNMLRFEDELASAMLICKDRKINI